MDSPAAAAPVIDSLAVGKAFVSQYYHILYNMPEHLHRFYQEISKVGRVGQDGVMRDFSTLEGISEELKSLTCGNFSSAEITSYDTQESHSGGFLLVVTGYFTQYETLRRKFTQTFFLAPQENGFFVLNDMFRFVNDDAKNNVPEAIDGQVVSGKDSTRPSLINGNKGSEQASCVSANTEVSKPLYSENAKDNVPEPPEIVNEDVPEIEKTCKKVAKESLKCYDPDDGLENVPKKSYASVLKVTKTRSGVSAVSSWSPKQIQKDQEHQALSDPSTGQILNDQGQQAFLDPSQVIESDSVSEFVDAADDGHNQEVVAEGTSIYVRHLPANATIDMLETEFKQFGAIINGGIQVISQRGLGYPYGFVEFEEADAAQRAIEASPVRIGGQRAFVEEKLSTSRGHRGSGYGNRNVAVRGRGGYGYGYDYRRGGGGGGRSFNRRGNEYVASINSY
ncbi:PREDICTED: ras GTPase-activating protein-binding protein 2-like [Camelina sativa]|uniref:Ras GTPase-activating protein-binding protein 2-like n=1 Tax=Camelina sativa TaxID=90675 RepID=A0ABM0Y0N7_CAMSA|nr:PREDICTED: ras GTPase-activating protein-binding protein 2-like [Camelina sativa]XP_010493701.1 PREDICTED: ras GTPase-activating protein-binding protein 2-like [Camelina sativa]